MEIVDYMNDIWMAISALGSSISLNEELIKNMNCNSWERLKAWKNAEERASKAYDNIFELLRRQRT